MFSCQECGKKFSTVASASRAMNNGCPKCGGSDIDVAPLCKPVAKYPATSPAPLSARELAEQRDNAHGR